MKRVIALFCLIAFALSGCAGGDIAIKENIFVNQADIDDTYDVIVYASEPEGVAAAVSAARNGMKTLLLSEDGALGGLMTLGELNFIDMCEGRDGTSLVEGIFREFYDMVGGSAFDITEAKNAFLALCENEDNLTLRTESHLAAPIMDGDELLGVKMRETDGEKSYYAKVIIDASADADLAALSGVQYTFAGEDIGEKDRQMGVTLVFELSGVDWGKVYRYLNFARLKAEIKHTAGGMGATAKMAWGYTDEGYGYEPHDSLMRLRGFNLARQDDGTVLVNALIIFGADVLDEESKAEAIARGQKELAYIIPYLRENCKGFANASLKATAPQLYVRESRHIIGEYQLTIDDVLENRDCWDKIAIGSYPVDVQPTAQQTYGTVVGNPDRYAIPYRSIVPLEVENLLVVGRSASYKSLAAGSARVIPIGMAEGEAAGAAAAYAVNNSVTVREIAYDKTAVASIQATLRAQGAYLEDFDLPEEIMSHWAYDGVKTLRALGLLDGGYDNNYYLEEPMGKWRYQNMLNGVLNKAGIAHDYIEVNDNVPARQVIGTAARAAAGFVGVKNPDDFEGYKAWLLGEGILTDELMPYFAESEVAPESDAVIMLCANLYKYLLAHGARGVQID